MKNRIFALKTSIININRTYHFRPLQLGCILALWLVCVLSGTHVAAQNISFRTLGLNEGLSEMSGLAIHQDHLNRMWFGTRNGLNCWDGIRMKQFYPVMGDTTSLMDHKIVEIIQDGKYLWLQSINGLSRLDLETLSFRRFYLEGVLNIGLYDDRLLVGTKNGLLAYDKAKERFYSPADLYSGIGFISAFCQDKEKVLWLADESKNQIVQISPQGTATIQIPVSEPLIIFDLLVTSKNKLCIATRYHGVIVYDLENKGFEFINKSSSPFHLKDLTVRSLKEDKEGRIWVGTFQGLAIFDLNKNSTSFIQASEKNEYGLSHNSVHCLYLSNDDCIWIGTYFGGINYGRISNEIFNKYNESAVGGGPSYKVIGPIIEDENRNIWIGTEGAGLDYYDRKKNTFKNYPFTNTKSGLSQSNVKSLLLTRDDQLLIGTYQGGLNVLDIQTDQFIQFNDAASGLAPKHVNSIIAFENDYLLATEHGVIRYDPSSHRFTPLFDPEKASTETQSVVSILYVDSNGILWIGLEFNGLMSYDPVSKQIRNYGSDESNVNAIAHNSINAIMEDHQFRLWVGTDGGLCLYDRSKDHFTTFNKARNNLPSDFVYGMAKSRFGNLWISTSKGLSRFDVEHNLFFNYENQSGFPLKELNYKALLLTPEGELFVGGIDGLISFKEEDLLMMKENHQVIFSHLEVNNEEVRANDKTGILETDISIARSFVLKPHHSVFKIDYSSCNYNRNLKNKFQYQLEGFDKGWVNAEYNSTVTYTNLNPGKYTFKVRGTDVVYNPITEEKTIGITVRPPLGRTWYAYTFYLLVIASIVLALNYFYLVKLRLDHQLTKEREDKDRIGELNLYKLRFFTNISHEFMTPLTIILSSIENIFTRSRIPADIKSQLALAFRNAKRLKNLNRELLDFRKIEQGYLKLHLQQNNMVPYLNEIFEAFSEIAHKKEITYTFVKNTDQADVFFDPAQMDKVFYNLLSNAFNHVAARTGQITLQLDKRNEALEISVIDNGVGIPEQEAAKVFDRFFQYEASKSDSQYWGSGIGLALTQSIVNAHQGSIVCQSQLNKGATFVVTLPKGEAPIDAAPVVTGDWLNRFAWDKELMRLDDREFDQYTLPHDEPVNPEAPLLLIVDDNPELSLVVQNLFSDSYRIELAHNGQEGLEKAIGLLPDMVISDVKMPLLSGFEMCEKIKRNANTSHILVILLTALDTEEDRTEGFKHGADSYCAKPFSSEMLKAMVENLLKNRELLQVKFSKELNVGIKFNSQHAADKDFMAKAQSIIEENILVPEFSVDEFAAQMGLSRTLFYSRIKTIAGQTPNDYIQAIRLNKAAEMLQTDPTKNISEVAYQTGFNSPRYFSLCFKNHFGVKPSTFVQQTKEKKK